MRAQYPIKVRGGNYDLVTPAKVIHEGFSTAASNNLSVTDRASSSTVNGTYSSTSRNVITIHQDHNETKTTLAELTASSFSNSSYDNGGGNNGSAYSTAESEKHRHRKQGDDDTACNRCGLEWQRDIFRNVDSDASSQANTTFEMSQGSESFADSSTSNAAINGHQKSDSTYSSTGWQSTSHNGTGVVTTGNDAVPRFGHIPSRRAFRLLINPDRP